MASSPFSCSIFSDQVSLMLLRTNHMDNIRVIASRHLNCLHMRNCGRMQCKTPPLHANSTHLHVLSLYTSRKVHNMIANDWRCAGVHRETQRCGWPRLRRCQLSLSLSLSLLSLSLFLSRAAWSLHTAFWSPRTRPRGFVPANSPRHTSLS